MFLATYGQQPIELGKYGTSVNGVLWPPKQLIRLTLGTDADNSHDAIRALSRLGHVTYEPTKLTAAGLPIVRAPPALTARQQRA
ncbi:hypothetical protein DN069_08200 [Streptacidiphilus pinicola]|uniref:Uncharacterized protein n=1 Tax=Streptacidiphilus pinicola TaxID=2219663 RepID=A0A2X0KGD2_9ACTN|nr:hypothetical protein [Streptacidiphilus pinicola]RAG86149.1 hypothetical protein DN069_08200 [Streptacidiphilus pinicola]